MAFLYGPYSAGSPAGASLTDAEWGEFGKALLGTGVVKGALVGGSAGADLAVSAPGSGMTVNLGTGQAMVYGHWCENDATAAQTITTADPSNPRIDRVVLKHDVTAKTISIVVKAGTPASSPTPPALTQTPSTWEMTLAQVRVDAAVVSIASGKVTDERTYAVPTGAVQKVGDTMTGTLGVTQTLGGTNKVFADFTASDGKRYQIYINTSGSLSIFNATDNVTVLSLGPAGGAITVNGQTVWTAANDGSGSALDADTVDTHHAADFALLASAPTFTGTTTAPNFAASAAGATLPTTRNGTNTAVTVFTGTGTPASPPTGSVWIKG